MRGKVKKEADMTSYNQSSEKVLNIIEYLAASKEPKRLMDIAEHFGYNTATTLRFLNSLQKCGYVDQESETMRYFLTLKLLRIAHIHENNIEIQKFTHPFLIQLSNDFGESTCISVERNMMMVYIDVASAANRILMGQQFVGNAVSMHSTGNGKLMLSQYTMEEIDALIEKKGLHRYTENTICTKQELLEELAIIRAHGYAIDNEESEIGMRCIAYPVYNDSGKIVAGVSVTGPTVRMTMDLIESKLEYLESVSKQLSSVIGVSYQKV